MLLGVGSYGRARGLLQKAGLALGKLGNYSESLAGKVE